MHNYRCIASEPFCKRLRGAWRDHRFPEPFSWFLHETGLESLNVPSPRCYLLKCQRKVSKKAKETPPVSWRPWALAYSRDRPYNFSCLSAVSKNRHFRSFFSALGCHLARKSLLWPAMLVYNKKQEFEQRKRIKLFHGLLSACVPIRFCPEAPASSTVDINSRFSRFQFSAFWSNGLASSVFICAPILLRFFLLSSSMQGLQYIVTDFLISTYEKSYASSKPTR